MELMLTESRTQAPRSDLLLFGEGQSRIVVSCRPEDVSAVLEFAATHAVPTYRLGVVGGDRFRWPNALDLPIEEVTRAWNVVL